MVKTLEDLYKEIENPVSFYKWMLKNIKYGYINVYNNKIVLNGNSITGWRLSSPKNTLLTRLGICHDRVWFEHNVFNYMKIEHKIFYLEGWCDNKPSGSHSFILFKSNTGWYHFECAWNDYNGIHMGNKDITDTLKIIRNKWSIDEGIKHNEIIIRELTEPITYGIDFNNYMKYTHMFPSIII